ncbi:hypothetical protein DCCM_3604 [Desulfocucumis palustris]|uniref:Uncharacterized protein n=1 Tax=Desulfocucumis palustris TaxID=1898651 RepID=A0A2L2XJP2_9FIRM|nr:hypothetical protein [Desulfocucumis palustris]GBF34486.1 hypothetical protein DCCM_3604 [Desulfocucumis palustris]
MGQEKEKQYSPRKIKLGRLRVDPVFLLLFLFFTISGLMMLLFISVFK